jgi:hypothetical protein
VLLGARVEPALSHQSMSENVREGVPFRAGLSRPPWPKLSMRWRAGINARLLSMFGNRAFSTTALERQLSTAAERHA